MCVKPPSRIYSLLFVVSTHLFFRRLPLALRDISKLGCEGAHTFSVNCYFFSSFYYEVLRVIYCHRVFCICGYIVAIFLGTPSANGVLESTALPVPSEKSSVLARMGTFGTSSASYGTFGDYNNYNHTSGFRLFRQRWYAMFVKRLLHSKRHKLAIISQLLLPLVYTLFALISAKTIPQPTDSPPLALSTLNFLNNDVPYYCVNRYIIFGFSRALSLFRIDFTILSFDCGTFHYEILCYGIVKLLLASRVFRQSKASFRARASFY